MSDRKRKKERINLNIRRYLGAAVILVSVYLFGNAFYSVLSGATISQVIVKVLAMMILLFVGGFIVAPVIKKKLSEKENGIQKDTTTNTTQKVA